MPLRGKILNVANASSQKMSQNQLCPISFSAGCGDGTKYRDEDLRYERVIIMTDADVDGRAYRVALDYILLSRDAGADRAGAPVSCHASAVQAHARRQVVLRARDEKHKDEILKKEFAANAKVRSQRFKGLGDMNAQQLKETTMQHDKRTLLKVEISDDRETVTDVVNALWFETRSPFPFHSGARSFRQGFGYLTTSVTH